MKAVFKEEGESERRTECLKQTAPNRWASVRKRYFTICFRTFTRGDKGSCVGCGSQLSGWSVKLNEIRQILKGCARDRTEADIWNFVLNAVC